MADQTIISPSLCNNCAPLTKRSNALLFTFVNNFYHSRIFFRMLDMKDENDEMPADFDNEIHKWSLECK